MKRTKETGLSAAGDVAPVVAAPYTRSTLEKPGPMTATAIALDALDGKLVDGLNVIHNDLDVIRRQAAADVTRLDAKIDAQGARLEGMIGDLAAAQKEQGERFLRDLAVSQEKQDVRLEGMIRDLAAAQEKQGARLEGMIRDLAAAQEKQGARLEGMIRDLAASQERLAARLAASEQRLSVQVATALERSSGFAWTWRRILVGLLLLLAAAAIPWLITTGLSSLSGG